MADPNAESPPLFRPVMIVVMIGGVLAIAIALVIPAWLRSRVATGEASPIVALRSLVTAQEQFKQQAEGADFELGVLSIGMTLESNAIKYFSGAAENTSENEVREFYEFLADWERQHLEALQALYNGVRQDFWSDGGFAPF